MGLDYRLHRRRSGSHHGAASVARREMRSALRSIAGVGLDFARGSIARLAHCSALVLWSTRARISSRPAVLLSMGGRCARRRHPGVGFGEVPGPSCSRQRRHPGRAPSGALHKDKAFSALRLLAVLLAALVFKGLENPAARHGCPGSSPRCSWSCPLLPFRRHSSNPAPWRTPRTEREFADWENAIPPTATVLVAPTRDVGSFVWFTLERPNYLALDQSSGVVFSRKTSLEVRRRSEVLLPLMDPDWKILTGLRQADSARKKEVTTRPLTAENLIAVCADPQLGFVIAPKKVGFDPVRHEHAGIWKDWNLYDCRKVRSVRSAT